MNEQTQSTMTQPSTSQDTSDQTRSATAGGPVQTRILASRIIDDVRSDLTELLSGLPAKMEDYLFDQADSTKDGRDGFDFFEAIRTIRARRTETSEALVSAIARDLDRAWKDNTPATRTSPWPARLKFNEMTLQSEAEMEISAAKTMIVSRGNAICGFEQACLTLTLNSIYGIDASHRVNCPLSLSSLLERFTEATAPLEFTSPTQLCLLQLFEQEVVANLRGIYRRALTRLENLGVPLIKPERFIPNGRRASRPDHDPTSRPGSLGFREFQGLLARSYRRSDPERGSSPGAAGFVSDVPALLGSLSAVQAAYLKALDHASVTDQPSYPNLEAFLLAGPADADAFKKAGPNEIDTLRIVSGLFDVILTDPDVSLICKALIARLQIPVLGLTIVDKSFFDQPEHPARQFINSLVNVSIGWPTSATVLQRHRLYLAAEILVQRINDILPPTKDTFAKALEKWKDLVARKNNHLEICDRRINQTVIGQARLNAARRISERVISTHVGRKLPPEVIRLIRNDWFQVLVVTCIKHGTECREWAEAQQAYESLVSMCRPDGTGPSGSVETAEIDHLVKHLARGLEAAGRLTAEARDTLLKAKLVIQNLHGAASAEEWERSMHNWEPLKAVHVTNNAGRSRNDLDHEMLKELHPGTWVEFGSEDLNTRCRLVVIDDETQSLVFANEDGLKVLERPAREMIADLEVGRMRVLTDTPVVTRALDDLKERLRTAVD